MDNESARELEVVGISQAAADVVSIELADPSGAPLPPWTPGSHIDLHLGPALERQYSLTGTATDPARWKIAVLRERDGRGGSEFVHEHFAVGTRVKVAGPRNNFELAPSPNYRFIAGGIGITPIIPMIAAAEAAGATWTLHYGGRTAASMAYAADLRETYGERVELVPQDEAGLLDLAGILGEPVDDVAVYCCGPEPLLRAVEEHCSRWPRGALHVERFVPRPVEDALPPAPFDVEIASSGEVYVVPSDRSVLDVVREAGVNIVSSCREGTCGTCETGVLEGIVDHRDSILDEDEREANDVMYVCVSRAVSPKLVLDL